MRLRTVLVLLVVVLALLAFIVLYEGKLPSSDDRAEIAKRVLRLVASEVEALELERQGERVLLERAVLESETPGRDTEAATRAEWRLVEPLVGRADQELVDSLVTSLTELEKRRTLEGVSPEEAGLVSPRARVTLRTPSAETELLVGREIPASSSMILAFGDLSRVYVVEDSIWSDLSRSAGDWRSREVFTGRRDEVDRVHVVQGSQSLLLARRGQDFWLEAPLTDRASADEVRNLLAGLTGLRVSEFVDEAGLPLSDYGLDPPAAEIEVVLDGEPQPFRLAWGGPVPEQDGRYYARAEGQLFETESGLGESLSRSAEGWRSRRIIALETYQIDRVRVVQGAEALELERAGADWRRNEDEISFTSVSDLLYALTGTRAQRLLDEDEGRALGFDLTMVALKISLEGKELSETVTFFAEGGEGVAVTVSDRQVVLLIEQKDFEEILAKLEAVREADSQTSTDLDEQTQGEDEVSADEES